MKIDKNEPKTIKMKIKRQQSTTNFNTHGMEMENKI